MGVPNTTTFTLQEVVAVVNPTTDDLVDCFADAVSSKFDSSYSGSKNSLLNFRNYDNSGLTPWESSNLIESNPCWETSGSIRWHNGSGPGPTVGDTCYLSNKTTVDANKSRKYFPSNSVELPRSVATNALGVVVSEVVC
jgi:hypothetical protein